ncbi:MAG: M42 family metallopeptidase [Acholeplasmataceae bacterium]
MIPKVYRDLFDLPGISGYEKEVRQYMKKEIEKYPEFEIVYDRLGSIFAYKKANVANAPTVMVAGHMDEVGLIVAKIEKNGMLRVQPIGGLVGDIFISQVLNIYTKDGVVKGIVGSIPPHIKTDHKAMFSDMILDIGATSYEEAKSFGVNLGDMVLYDNPFSYTKNKKRVIAKAIDNRFGCGLALESIAHFAKIDLPVNLYIGATVQEEVGLRGAETTVNLFKPDVFIALDASPVNDAFDDKTMAKLGGGFLIRMYDPRNTMLQSLRDYFVDVATKNKISFQHFTSMGGTDAAKALDLNEGVLATTIGLPARYIHSTAAMMDLDDLKEARRMLFTLLKTFNQEIIIKLKEQTYEKKTK